MFRAKVVTQEKVTQYRLPSLEGTQEPAGSVAGRPARKAVPPRERTPEDIAKEAYARGLEEGRRAGAEGAAREAEPLLSGLRAAIAGVEELRRQVVSEAEPQVVSLAMAVARRILVGELTENPERIVEVVKEAIRRIERAGSVTIRVHPDLSALIASLKGRSTEYQAEILLDVDPSVPPHGPIVAGPTEEVLTDIDEQIRVIMDELRSERAAR